MQKRVLWLIRCLKEHNLKDWKPASDLKVFGDGTWKKGNFFLIRYHRANCLWNRENYRSRDEKRIVYGLYNLWEKKKEPTNIRNDIRSMERSVQQTTPVCEKKTRSIKVQHRRPNKPLASVLFHRKEEEPQRWARYERATPLIQCAAATEGRASRGPLCFALRSAPLHLCLFVSGLFVFSASGMRLWECIGSTLGAESWRCPKMREGSCVMGCSKIDDFCCS